MPPVPEPRLSQLRKFYVERLKARLQATPALHHVHVKFKEVLTGRPFVATKAWLTSDPDQQSLLDWQNHTPTGGCTARHIDRWRADFTSKSALHELSHPLGYAQIPRPYNLTQSDIGTPRPPSFRDTVRAPSEMEEELVAHLTKCLTIAEVDLVASNDLREGELFIPLFAVFKPEDAAHAKPRWCLQLKEANDPARSVHQRSKQRSGFRGTATSTQRNDCGAAADVIQGYKEVMQDLASRRRQRYLIPRGLWDRATAAVEAECPPMAIPVNAHTRIVWAKGVECVIVEPRTLQFGAMDSSSKFIKRLGFMLSALRQEAGCRFETQVDDIEMKSAHGPQSLFADMLIVISTAVHYGWQLHLTDAKADQLWPRGVWTFDGVVIRPHDLQAFSPADRDERHRNFGLNYVKTEQQGGHHTLRELAQLVGQANSHRVSHYPTPLLMCTVSRFKSDQVRLWQQRLGFENDAIWEQTVPHLPARVRSDVLYLLQPRAVGNHLRPHGPTVGAVVSDTSPYRVGYRIETPPRALTVGSQTVATGPRVVRGSFPLVEHEQALHHTQQECRGTCHATLTGILHNDLNPPEGLAFAIVVAGNDNTATIKNLNNPGSKPPMVLHQLDLVLECWRRGLILVAQHYGKYYMDVLTAIDYDGRKRYHFGDLGVQTQVIDLAVQQLGLPWTRAVDLMACRATAKGENYISRYPDGRHDRLRRCDVRTYHLSRGPELQGRTLYMFPPERMAQEMITKITTELTPGQQLILVVNQPTYLNSAAVLEDLVVTSILLPFTPTLFVHPGGSEATGGTDLLRSNLIIASLSKARSGSKVSRPRWPRLSSRIIEIKPGDWRPYPSNTLPSS